MKTLSTPIGFLFLCFITTGFSAYAQSGQLQFEHISLDGVLLSVAQQGSEDRYNVDCMLQDSMGYLWFGSWDGLRKFDSYNFTTYKHIPGDTSSLIQNSIFTIWQDANKTIWLGTAEGGITKFDRYTGKFTQYTPVSDSATYIPPLRAVSAINEDNEGNMWVGNYLGELMRFNKETGTFYPQTYYLDNPVVFNNNKHTKEDIYSKGHDAVNCIYKDHTGTIWIGNMAGLHKLILTKGKAKDAFKIRFENYLYDSTDVNSLSNNAVTSIFEDHTHQLWIGTDGGGLNKFDQHTHKFTRYLHNTGNSNSISHNAIARNNIAEDKMGNLWIGTFNGLNKLDSSRTHFTSYFHDPYDASSISSNFIESLLIDKSGIMWVGSHWKGVDKFDPHQKPFKLYTHSSDDNSLSNNLVTAIYGYGNKIIVGTAGGGLNVLDKTTGRFTIYKHSNANHNSIDDDIVNSIIPDAYGKTWIRCGDLISAFDAKTGKFIHYTRDSSLFKAISKEHITAMYFDHNNRLWLGTHSGIKCLDMQNDSVTIYRHNPDDPYGLSDNVVYVFFEDKDGFLWMGHGSVGVSKLDLKTGLFKHYLPRLNDSTTLSTSVVNSIYQDAKGVIWLATLGGGLCRFNASTETFTTYTEKNGLSDNTIVSVLEDDNNNLWLATDKGLSKFSTVTRTFTNYDDNDGLQGKVFSEAAFKDANGTLYFGGLNGFNAFTPQQIQANDYVPPVVITQFKVFSKLLPGKNEAKQIILKSSDNFFSFQFAALNFSNAPKNNFAYQLVGVDDEWVYSGTTHEANYTDVAPGNYVFRVKAANNDGVWNNEGTSINITVLPPWWRTKLAYIIYAVSFLSLVVWLNKWQHKRFVNKERVRARDLQLAQVVEELEAEKQEQKNREAEFKKRLADLTVSALRSQINPHFIFNCLNSIKLYAMQNNITAAAEYLTKFSKLIRQALDNSRSEKVTLAAELEVLQLLIEMEVMRFKNKLNYSITIDKNIDADFIEIPPLLLQPYVENAIWHGLMPKDEGGIIEIRAGVADNSTLVISIKDNGIGRKKAAEIKSENSPLQQSFGIQITAERMAILNQMYNTVSGVTIDDLTDYEGNATGTLVTINIQI